MDGARLMNAVVQSGVEAARHCAGYDSAWIDFSKGLGAPVGAVLAGSQAFIDRAWIFKQQFGGAMRQSGILAAMCLFALDHNVDRLSEDHVLAQSIAGEIANYSKVDAMRPVETNIIIFDLAPEAPTAADLVAKLDAEGLRIGAFAERRVRIVTHLDVGPDAGEKLCAALGRHLA